MLYTNLRFVSYFIEHIFADAGELRLSGRTQTLLVTVMVVRVGASVSTHDLTTINSILSLIINTIHEQSGAALQLDQGGVIAVFSQSSEANQVAEDIVEQVSASIGIATGDLHIEIVGDDDLQLHLRLSGPVLDSARLQLEAAAGPGVYHATTASSDVVSPLSVAEIASSQAPLAGFASRFTPVALRDQFAVEQLAFTDEQRPVTVIVVRYSPEDHSGYFVRVVNVVGAYGGYVERITPEGIFHVVVGAPAAYEDHQRRALRCALDLGAIAGTHAIALSIGDARCGILGSALLYQYVVVGETVDQAADLLTAASSGEIRVMAAVSVDGFRIERQDDDTAILLGEIENEALYLAQTAYRIPTVGRAAELERIDRLLDEVVSQRGQVIGIRGEAGIGKTRLANSLVNRAAARGMVGYGGQCESVNANLSYVVWGEIWRGFFGLDSFMPLDQQYRQLQARLASVEPAFLQRMPLLNPIFGLDIPQNTLTAELDPMLRVAFLHSLLLSIIRSTANRRQLVFVLEDCHWLDPASMELLVYLARGIVHLPVLIVVAYRPPIDEDDQTVADALAELPHFSEINLTNLTSVDAIALVDAKAAQLTEPLPENLKTRVIDQAEGNPFYIEELINHIAGHQGVDLDSISLPTSLRSLILSRVDQLAANEQVLLRVASVIGRLFRASWVVGSQPGIGVPAEIQQQLARLSELELTLLDRPEPELVYLFKHVLTQEVMYTSLAAQLRATLHERVAVFIENTYPEQQALHLDALAYHYGNTSLTEKQRVYFRRAGDAATARYASESAVYYYARLLPLLDEDKTVDVRIAYGRMLAMAGQWDAATAAFMQIIDGESDDIQRAHARLELGTLFANRGQFDEALVQLQAGQAALEGLGDAAGLITALNKLSFTRLNQMAFEDALAYAEQHLTLATGADEPIALSDAHQNIGLVQMYTGAFDGALDSFRQAVQYADSVGYLPGVIYSKSNMANILLNTGQVEAAVQTQTEAALLAVRIGYVRMVGIMLLNLGVIYEKAPGDSAQRCFLTALDAALELDDRPAMGYGLSAFASLLKRRERVTDCIRVSDLGVTLSDQLGIPYLQCRFRLLQAWAAQMHKNNVDAVAYALKAETIGKQIDDAEVWVEARVIALQARVTMGSLPRPEATAQIRALQAQFDDAQADLVIQATLLYGLWQLNPSDTSIHDESASFYREIYTVFPDEDVRDAYHTITGQTLPPLPVLPPVTAALPLQDVSWERVVDDIARIISV